MGKYYSSTDFIKSPKYDSHIHYHTFNDFFVRKANKANIRLITINTNFGFLPLDTQFEISQFLHQHYPETFDFICSFDATRFSYKTFVEDAIEQIKKCMISGARGVKIWKNVGMALKNEAGHYIMADDPLFDPIYKFLEKEKIPLLAHLGEPRSCWLPVEEMIISTDKRYFSKNPKFHMYLHSEAPSYEQHLIVRDRILESYPGLIFVGAHLGSMEWNLEEVAKRLDKFPNFYVDLSVQFEHILEQTIRNRNYVIDFFETYQNRILYATDYFVSLHNRRAWMNFFCKYFPQVYMNLIFKRSYRTIEKHWLFFATDKLVKTREIKMSKYIGGLKLSKNIVDRIFYENACSVYGIAK